jgi:hypothetical protein
MQDGYPLVMAQVLPDRLASHTAFLRTTSDRGGAWREGIKDLVDHQLLLAYAHDPPGWIQQPTPASDWWQPGVLDRIPPQRTSAHAADRAPDAGHGTCSHRRGVSAEALCADFHKPLPRKRCSCRY